MGVIAQSLSYVDSENKASWYEQAQNSYEKNDIDNCIAVLSKACKLCKEELVKKPHNNFYRSEISLIWGFLLDKTKETLITHQSNYDKQSQPHLNPFNTIKAYVLDSLIETEWKKQCVGKFGGLKRASLSWKEYYLKNESEVDQLEIPDKKLSWAIENGHINYVKFLLNQYDDLDINKLSFKHKLSGISKAISKNYLQLTRYLLDEDVKLDTSDEFGAYPIHHAVNSCNLKMVKLIVKQKVALNVRNKDGHTPLHLAILNSRNDIAKFLISEGAKINYKDKQGFTPLYFCLITRDISMLELLLENGADIKFKDLFGRTLLHICSMLGYATLLKELLKFNISIDAKDKFGRTALHYAAQYGQSNCLDILIKENAKLSLQDNFNDTPLLVAAYAENKAETAILHEWGTR